MFASVGDDKMLKMWVFMFRSVWVHGKFFCSWDTRQKAPTSSMQAHDQEILAVAFNPGSETLLITGSADKVRFRAAATRGKLINGSK